MVTTTTAVTSTISKTVELHVTTVLPLNIAHLKQTTAVVRVMVNLRMVTTIVTSAT
jgi:hypothetical protein